MPGVPLRYVEALSDGENKAGDFFNILLEDHPLLTGFYAMVEYLFFSLSMEERRCIALFEVKHVDC